MDKEKIHVEKLTEDAWDWWLSSDIYFMEQIIVREYMHFKSLKQEDVSW